MMNDEFPEKTAKAPHQSPRRKRESAVGHGLPSVKGSADSLFLVAQFSKSFLDRPLWKRITTHGRSLAGDKVDVLEVASLDGHLAL